MDFPPIETCFRLLIILAATSGVEITVMVAADDNDVLETGPTVGVRLVMEGFEPVDLFLDGRDSADVCEVTGMDEKIAIRYLDGRLFAMGIGDADNFYGRCVGWCVVRVASQG